MMVWRTKEFKFKSSENSIRKAQKARDSFIKKNKHRYQMEEVFLNNAYGVEYRPLRRL